MTISECLRPVLRWLLVMFLGCCAIAQVPNKPADLVLVHSRIYTVNPKQPWAEALAIREGKLLAVGTDRDIARYRGTSTQVIDGKGRLVLPGFTDCHVHFLDGSFSLQQVSLDDAKTIGEIQQRVKTYASAHPNDAWVLGRGWTYPVFAPSGLPDKKYLDAIIPDRPVYLEGFDGHTWWANSRALAAAHITKETPDPPGGRNCARSGDPRGNRSD